MFNTVDSVAIFKGYSWCWKVLGLTMQRYQFAWRVYDALLTVFVTFGFPLHLLIGLFYSHSQEEFLSTLVIFVASIACTIKFYTYRPNLQLMDQIKDLFAVLDRRAIAPEQRIYFHNMLERNAKRILMFYYIVYVSVSVTSLLSLLTGEERTLLYHGWFPFDWSATTFTYVVAVLFQYIGLTMQVLENFANDVYAPLCLWVLAGHVHLLGMRVASIGHDDEKSADEYNSELTACIEDYKNLMSIYTVMQDFISHGLFVQFTACSFNVCIAVVYLLFFADGLFMYVYYITYILAVSVEIFPCCYYGTIMEMEFRKLPHAIYSSNWLMRTREFRKNVLIFTELSLKVITAYAGGMVRIHIDSFFATCKLGYSFFTVIQSMK